MPMNSDPRNERKKKYNCVKDNCADVSKEEMLQTYNKKEGKKKTPQN